MTGLGGPGPLAGRRVLIVEDHFLIAEEMRRAVHGLGGTVVGPAPGLDEARRLIAVRAPDMAVLDINLGKEQVWPVAEVLRDHRVPMIFATGYEKGAIDPRFTSELHLEKPVTARALSAAVQSLRLQDREV